MSKFRLAKIFCTALNQLTYPNRQKPNQKVFKLLNFKKKKILSLTEHSIPNESKTLYFLRFCYFKLLL